MRIVSLLPATTSWVLAFGGGGDLVGCSHGCKAAGAGAPLPVLTRAAATQDEVDFPALWALRPDVLLGGPALAEEGVAADVRARPGRDVRVFAMAPRSFKEVLDNALQIGRLIGRVEAAMRYLAAAEADLQRLRQGLGLRRDTDPDTLPSVLCLTASPAGGGWIPDVVSLAGGRPVPARHGDPVRIVQPSATDAGAPDVLLALGAAAASVAPWQASPTRLRAYAVTRPEWFTEPGPELYRAVALVAALLYGKDGAPPEGAVPLTL